MKVRLNYKNIAWYLILFPFLYPRGFSEYFPIYKHLMTFWLYIAIIGILFYFFVQFSREKIKIKDAFIYVILYFGAMLLETVLLQGGVNEGLQKVFATPSLFMLFMIAFRKKTKEVIIVIANILLCDNLLNCTIFNPLILKKILGNGYIANITFVGHVQMCAQIGVLGIAIAYCILHFGCKKKGKTLIVLSLITMLLSEAITSYIVSVIIVIAFLFYNYGGKYILARHSPKLIFVLGTILQAAIIPIVVYYKIDFGARYYVWIDALRQLADHYLTGFGVYGVSLHTFWMEWTGDTGMNYAHNEVLQILLDGGIVLLCCYVTMCLNLIKKYCAKKDLRTRYWFNCFLMLFMVVGLCDSITEYNYYYIFLLILLFLPEISLNFEENLNWDGN